MSLGRLSLPTDPLDFGRFEPDPRAPRQINSAGDGPNRSRRRLIVVAGTSTTIVEALGTALAGQPGVEVICTVVSEAGIFEAISRQRPDGLVFYVPKLDMGSIKTVERLKQQDPAVRVVILTGQSSMEALAQAAEAGAAACLSLNAHVRDLAQVVRADTTDTMLVDTTSLSVPSQGRSVETGGVFSTALTRRELEVLTLLADGCSPPVIAAKLVISIYTARGHVKSVLRKLGAHSQLEAVAQARKLGLLGPVPNATWQREP
jgi:DNA-binding NarL/FixJ family response regulator